MEDYIFCQGMPEASRAKAFISGNWNSTSWKNLVPIPPAHVNETSTALTLDDEDDLDSTVESPIFSDTLSDEIATEPAPVTKDSINTTIETKQTPDDEDFPWD